MCADAVHLFLNPTAGRGRAGKREARIVEIFERGGVALTVHRSDAVGDLETQVLAATHSGVRKVIVAGGDGSVHEAANGIMRGGNNAALGVIPTGTGNDFAKAADITLEWEHATALLADRIVADESTRPVDIGRMNERYFVNGAGVGFDAKVTRIARSYRIPIGDLVYLLAIFRSMAGGIATPQMRITGERKIWDGPVTLANVANGAWIGGMFHIAPVAANNDGHFDLLLAAPVSRRRIVTLLPKLMAGTHMGEREIVHEPVRNLLIECDEPVASHLDGEVQRLQQRFEIVLLAGALALL
ncbi:MAG: diacylglycerol kinase family lipid kinase [Woeseiaceae bacterium]|nr:diacylglycerol kinase family lipid kinase [Woeseiaceae bacterium]